MHTVCQRRVQTPTRTTGDRPPTPRPGSRSPAPPATPARSCCGCCRGIRRSVDRRDLFRLGVRRGAAAAGAGAHLGRRDHAARRRRARRAKPTSCSWRCPIRRRRSSAPRSSRPACASIDLSGAFRLRDAAARVALVSGNAPHAGRRGLRPDRARARRGRRRAAGRQSGLLSRRRRCWRWRRWWPQGSCRRRRRHRRREVRRVGRRQDAVGAHALLRVPWQPLGVRRLRPPARRRDRAGARPSRSRSRRTWCRSTAAFWPRSTCASRRGTTEEPLGDVFERAYADDTFVRLTGVVAAGDQARRAHELLRHRLACRSVRAARFSCR